MTHRHKRQLATNTLSNLSVIGFGLFLYEGRFAPLVFAVLAYGVAYLIAKGDDDNAG